MSETEHAIKIAVIQEQVFGLREQQRLNSDAAQGRFNAIEEKIDELAAIMNRGRGAYAASMALAAGMGALLIECFSTVVSYFHR